MSIYLYKFKRRKHSNSQTLSKTDTTPYLKRNRKLKEKSEEKEKWGIPPKHLREACLIRWRDLSSGARLVYFFLAFGFLIKHHRSLAANRGAVMQLS